MGINDIDPAPWRDLLGRRTTLSPMRGLMGAENLDLTTRKIEGRHWRLNRTLNIEYKDDLYGRRTLELRDVIRAIRDDVVRFDGDERWDVQAVAPLSEARVHDISFCNKSGIVLTQMVSATASQAIIVSSGERLEIPENGKNIIYVRNPRLSFLRVVSRCFCSARPRGVDISAIVHPEAEIDPAAYIGPQCYIGRATIGRGSVLWGRVFVYDGVRISGDVTIHAGAVIGSDGFGYERNDDGQMEKFPHIGGVRIGNNVEIGANTCIDRGTLGDTILEDGAKIDNLVHIAHNVRVGRDAVVIANAMVGGSTKIGNRAWIAPSACLRDQIVIGDDATVGLAAVVTKNVDSGDVVMGSPATSRPTYLKSQRAIKKLTEDN